MGSWEGFYKNSFGSDKCVLTHKVRACDVPGKTRNSFSNKLFKLILFYLVKLKEIILKIIESSPYSGVLNLPNNITSLTIEKNNLVESGIMVSERRIDDYIVTGNSIRERTPFFTTSIDVKLLFFS